MSVVVGVVGDVGAVGEVGVATTASPVSVAGWAFTHPATSGRARSITMNVCRIVVEGDETETSYLVQRACLHVLLRFGGATMNSSYSAVASAA